MNGEQWLDELGENILGFLAEYTNAQAGALFIKNGDAFIRRATYGTPAESNIPTRVRPADGLLGQAIKRSEEHTSELQSLMRISYAVFCLKKTIKQVNINR